MSAIDPKDLPEIIELATRLESTHDDEMTLAEVQRIAAELELSPEAVREAVDALGTRRRVEAAAAKARGRLLRRIAIGIGAALIALLGLAAVGRGGLADRLTERDRAAAQLQNVQARRAAITAQYAGAPDSPDRRAALEGAENRVRVERQRYDEACVLYDRQSASLTGWLARLVFPDLPPRAECAP